MIRRAFLRAGTSTFLDDLRADQTRAGVTSAIRNRDTPRLFQWLVSTLSYQGISDRVARQYIDRTGEVDWRQVAGATTSRPACPQLQSFWHFHACGYRKSAAACRHPDLMSSCGLPTAPLRNGRLNQTAFSLYLFIRDVADGDLPAWIDRRLEEHGDGDAHSRSAALIEAMCGVFGVSHKVIAMLLSALLLAPDHGARPLWFETGASMIVVDTLVHNFLHRTGILAALNATHRYGPACYAAGGCAAIVQAAAAAVDASVFNPGYPRYFPRLVQHAIWRFCAQGGLNVCNGNRAKDRGRCHNRYCPELLICQRVALAKSPEKPRN